MKILFLNRFFFPDHSATSQMLSDLAFALAKRGYAVEVITSFLSYDGSKILKRRETVRGVSIVRLWTTSFGRGSLLGKTFDYLTFYLSALFSLIWRVRPGDLVIAKTDPPMLPVLTVPLSHIRGARAINWLQDVFPEVAEELGIGRWRAQKPLLALLRAMRNATLCRASVNVVLGHGMAHKLLEFGVPNGRIRIIPNWASGELIRPVSPQSNALRKEWGLDGAFVVGYSGNLGRAHDIETFLAAIAALEEPGSRGAKPRGRQHVTTRRGP